MDKWRDSPVIRRTDGTYVITLNGLPYHVTSDDAMFAVVQRHALEHPALVSDEAAYAPTQAEIISRFTCLIQRRLDDFARTKTYDGMLSLCSYATSSDPVFAAEGQYGVRARDATWRKANDILAAALAGGTEPDWDAVEAQLPPLAWPDVEG